MYEVSYGSAAQATADLTVKEVAARIRADVKAAKAAGQLPADLNVSVRYSHASMCQSIDVEVRDALHLWEQCDGRTTDGFLCRGHHYGCPDTWTHNRLTVEGAAVVEVLEAIHGAYNYDGSETQVDYFHVRYYGQVGVEEEWRRGCRLAEADARKARAAARLVSA